jgi:hypothetical protein
LDVSDSSRLNVYQYGNGPVSSSSSTVTFATVVPTSTPTAITTVPPTMTSSTSSTVTTTVVLTTTSLPAGFSYQGCWVDNANGRRVMNNQQPDYSQTTVESCVSRCTSLGYSVAGIEYGVQCFCDNVLRNGAAQAQDSDCGMVCPENPAEKCGAGNRLSVFSNSTLTVLPVPTVQKSHLPGNWQYAGCIIDTPNSRALPYQIILDQNNTASNCISQCSAFGYNAGGLEYGRECCK